MNAQATATATATAETVASEAGSTDTLNDITAPAEHVGSATYSPEDNKLRLYPLHRLDAETYARVKAAGFKWAPKQELFVAPMWTPGREDLLIELCGSIEPEEMSLEERQAERAERFAEYSGKRAADSAAARRAVDSVAQHIPLGQPILVGHHSERRARKDAERIENNMRRAVRMWETAEYWQRRAAAAKAHADYKADPAVRARRIKTLEAEIRKLEREDAERADAYAALTREGLTLEQAQRLAGCLPACYGLWSALDKCTEADDWRRVVADAAARLAETPAARARWMEHFRNRAAYERAMIDDAGGLVGERQDLKVGGRVLVRGEWLIILRLNKKGGAVVSVTTNARFVRVRPVEEIDAYEPPSEEQAAAVAERVKIAPLCNYPGEGFAHMTRAQWDRINKDYKGTREHGAGAKNDWWKDVSENSQNFERHRVRYAMGVYTGAKGDNARHSYGPVFITDEKVKEPRKATQAAAPAIPAPEPVARAPHVQAQPREKTPEQMQIDQMRDTLSAGGVKVEIVHAPDLYPTPPELAARMVELADIKPCARVLEPSAGTGRLIDAIPKPELCVVVAVEANATLAEKLQRLNRFDVWRQDFLALTGEELGGFDRILMNPPFSNAADIKHIQHAAGFLQPGGRLVAICADGPRQRATLQPMAEQSGGFYEPLPAGTFASEGTNVNTAILVIEG